MPGILKSSKAPARRKMRKTGFMKKIISIIFLASAFSGAQAAKCKFEMADISEAIRMPGAQKVIEPQQYVDSLKQPTRRYVQLLTDGAVLVVEQKNCEIVNFSVSILIPSGVNMAESSKKVVQTLGKIPEWKKWFDAAQMEVLKKDLASARFKSSLDKPGNFSHGLDNEIKARGESSNVAWELSNREVGSVALFQSVFSIFVSVGGE